MSATPVATAEQARGLDAAAERMGVSGDSLMALAGFQCARLARSLLEELADEARVAVVAGKGNNGGDALGCGRHLAAWGHPVRALILGGPPEPGSTSDRQARAASDSGVEVRAGSDNFAAELMRTVAGADLIVDGLLGTGSRGAPHGEVAVAVERINGDPARVLAIDVPSGLDATTGAAAGSCVVASATLMLAIAKVGCLEPAAQKWVGRLFVADIGVPTAAYRAAGLVPPRFAGASLSAVEPTS